MKLPSDLRPITLAIVACLLAGFPAPAQQRAATGASEWSRGLHSAVRLLDGGVVAGNRTAGIEVRLDPHFKTYWRTPGDSGLPPVFDWSGSQNVREVTVRWPAPVRFDDSAGSSIGYQDTLVLPLVVIPQDTDRPVVLALKLDYAVCEKICIPAKAEARLSLPASSLLLPHAAAVRKAEARVPVPSQIDGDAAPGLRALAVEPGGRALMARVVVPAAAGIVDIFAEGPDGWIFAGPVALAASAMQGDMREITYRIGVDARPAGASLANLPVNVTVTAGDDAIEVVTHLDAGPKPH
jgi:DsbC/DsbD-like thiol-disulfide interchange protein